MTTTTSQQFALFNVSGEVGFQFAPLICVMYSPPRLYLSTPHLCVLCEIMTVSRNVDRWDSPGDTAMVVVFVQITWGPGKYLGHVLKCSASRHCLFTVSLSEYTKDGWRINSAGFNLTGNVLMSLNHITSEAALSIWNVPLKIQLPHWSFRHVCWLCKAGCGKTEGYSSVQKFWATSF